jgi:NADPH:quinone reductase-like Zn-dependent oxidoreductase
VGLNPVECRLSFVSLLTAGKIIDFGLYGDPPTILGYDVAGVIEQVGPDVKNYKKGDRMY